MNENALGDLEVLYIKSLARRYGDNIRDLAKAINKNDNYVYDIMNKRRTLSYDVFESICSYYDVKYNDDPSLYQYGYDMVIHLTEAFIKKNNTLKYEYEKDYLIRKDELNNSKCFILCPIIEFILAYLNKQMDKYDALIKIIDKSFKVYDENISYCFLIFYNYSHPIVTHIAEYKEFLKYLDSKLSLTKVNPYVRATTYFILGDYNDLINDTYLSLSNFQKAIEEFKDLFLVERVVQCQIHIAILISRSGQNERAIAMLDKALKISLENKFTTRIIKCLNIKSYFYMVLGDYKKSLECINEALKYGSNFDSLYYYEVIDRYYLEGKDFSVALIANYFLNVTDYYTKLVLTMLDNLFNNRIYKFKRDFNKLEEYNVSINDFVEMDLIYKIIIDYFEAENNNIEKGDFLEKYFKFKSKKI